MIEVEAPINLLQKTGETGGAAKFGDANPVPAAGEPSPSFPFSSSRRGPDPCQPPAPAFSGWDHAPRRDLSNCSTRIAPCRAATNIAAISLVITGPVPVIQAVCAPAVKHRCAGQ
ncbi:MAG: hypothetical protein ACREE9_11740, partial [Stellaceae bacterium]